MNVVMVFPRTQGLCVITLSSGVPQRSALNAKNVNDLLMYPTT